MDTVITSNIAARRVELKFAIDASQSNAIRQWARDHMLPDENVAKEANDTYQITSLYLDTPQFDTYHRTKGTAKGKHRLRRYGCERSIWLETKRKSKDVVKKRRTLIGDGEITTLFNHESLQSISPKCEVTDEQYIDVSPTAWFQRRVHEFQLRPATYVCYSRFARTATDNGQAIRLTIDSDLTGAIASDWTMPSQVTGLTKLTEMEVLELKFEETLPPLFKGLMLEFSFTLNKFSKYRSSVDASHRDALLGLVA